MTTPQVARNIEVEFTFKSFSGKEERHSLQQFIMAPDSSEIWAEYQAFNRGHRDTVQGIVNLAYWGFLRKNGAYIEAHLLPTIPYKFDRKTKDAIVFLQDGCTLTVCIHIDLAR